MQMGMSLHALWCSVLWRSCRVDVCIFMYHAFLSRWKSWLSGCKRTHLVLRQACGNGCVSYIHGTTPFLQLWGSWKGKKKGKTVEDRTWALFLRIPGFHPLERSAYHRWPLWWCGGGRSWWNAMGRHAPRIQLTYESRTSRYGILEARM